MKILIPLFLLAASCQAQQLTLSSNPDLLYSTGNDFGLYGAPESLSSLSNSFGLLGSRDSLTGAANEYGLGVSVKVVEPTLEFIEVPLEVP